MKIHRIYHHYLKWEDHQHGLYALPCHAFNEPHLIAEAMSLLSDQTLFLSIARSVIREWKYSAEVNLSNPNRNRQAWIGQASCCMFAHVPEYLTKLAWHGLTSIQQQEANRTADIVIAEWESQYAQA